MHKLNLVYTRSLTKDFDYEQMAKCKSITEQLDVIREEKFNEIFGYFKNTNDLITNTRTVI